MWLISYSWRITTGLKTRYWTLASSIYVISAGIYSNGHQLLIEIPVPLADLDCDESLTEGVRAYFLIEVLANKLIRSGEDLKQRNSSDGSLTLISTRVSSFTVLVFRE